MASEQSKSGRIGFRPEDTGLEYKELYPFFEDLAVAYRIVNVLSREYRCHVHAGMGKWVSVGLYKKKWFARMWRLSMSLNRHYFDNSEVFFQLMTHWYSPAPYLLNFLVEGRDHGFKEIKRYSIEEIQDAALVERDIRAVLDAELVTGKAWDF